MMPPFLCSTENLSLRSCSESNRLGNPPLEERSGLECSACFNNWFSVTLLPCYNLSQTASDCKTPQSIKTTYPRGFHEQGSTQLSPPSNSTWWMFKQISLIRAAIPLGAGPPRLKLSTSFYKSLGIPTSVGKLEARFSGAMTHRPGRNVMPRSIYKSKRNVHCGMLTNGWLLGLR